MKIALICVVLMSIGCGRRAIEPNQAGPLFGQEVKAHFRLKGDDGTYVERALIHELAYAGVRLVDPKTSSQASELKGEVVWVYSPPPDNNPLMLKAKLRVANCDVDASFQRKDFPDDRRIHHTAYFANKAVRPLVEKLTACLKKPA